MKQKQSILQSEIIQSPYAASNPAHIDQSSEQTSDLLKQNGTLLARVHELSREIKDLKQDIATLFICWQGVIDTKMTNAEAKQIYQDFRRDSAHLTHRITDKLSKTGEINNG